MPLIGIDFGTETCKVALASKGGIDVITNEFSKRATPSVVSFTQIERHAGETASNNVPFNYLNTVHNLKRLVGLKYSQIEDDIKRGMFTCKLARGNDDEILIEIKYLNETRHFTPIQVLAALFVKLRSVTEKNTGSKAAIDAVIAVPAYYTEQQRRAVMQAAKIADLHVLRLINDVTAAAVSYGIYHKYEEDATKTTNVAFVDVGHADTTVSIIQFAKGSLKVLSSVCDSHLGAVNFEHALSEHLAQQIKAKYGLDVSTNPKAQLRLSRESDKLKKILGSNPIGQLRIEAFMNDVDIGFEITRDQYNEVSKHMAERFQVPVRRVLEQANLTAKDVAGVEVIGGGSYIPVLRDVLAAVFEQQVSQSLNAMEAVARGAALQGALISPMFHLARKIEVIDTVMYAVNMGWKKNVGAATSPAAAGADAMDIDQGAGADNGDVKFSPLFKVRDTTPNVKQITFSKTSDFELFFAYAHPEEVAVPHTDAALSKFTISGFPKTRSDALKSQVKVKVKHNINGTVEVDSAVLSEEVEEEELVPAPAEQQQPEAAAKPATPPAADAQAPAADAAAAAPAQEPAPAPAEPKMVARKIKKTHSYHLQVVQNFAAGEISQELLKRYISEEQKMQAQDRIIQETAEAKNDVETLVYYLRDNVGDKSAPYGEYVEDAARNKLMETLDDVENWLYDSDGGENATKEEYVKRLTELRKAFAPIENRKKEDEGRQGVVNTLLNSVDSFKKFVDSKEEQYAHIDETERGKVSAECDKAMAWLADAMEKQSKKAKHQDPVFTMDEVTRKDKYLRDVCNPIVNKPKPKPPKPAEQPKPEEQPAAQQPTAEQPKPQEQQQANGADMTDVD